jgi:hypothetical protein
MAAQQERSGEAGASPARPAAPTRAARIGRIVFVCLAAAFAACVLAQVFIAGMAVFINPLNWRWHTTFIHVFEFLPLLMLIFSFVGRLPVAQRWQSGGLFLLIYAQYFTANVAAPLPFAAAAHPVIALVIFWLATRVLSQSWGHAFRTHRAGPSA